jgi:signal transduction histidine kinase
VNNHRSHFRATVTCSVDIDHLFASDFRIVIYRIVQEALTNVAKHARAQNVFITISELDDDRISVLVEDDGQGFDFAGESLRAFADKGLGLATMRERAQMLRGTIEVRSQKGAGTRVLLIVSKAKREIG